MNVTALVNVAPHLNVTNVTTLVNVAPPMNT